MFNAKCSYPRANNDPSFCSPIGKKGKSGKLSNWGMFANSKSKSSKSSINKHYYYVLEHLYESIRIIINSKQTAIELAFTYLDMWGILDINNQKSFPVSIIDLLQPLRSHWFGLRSSFNRIRQLQEVILHQKEKFKDSLRCIIFVQQRISTHILQHALKNNISIDHNTSMISSDILYAGF